jgi:uncharacterized protein
MCLDFLMQSHFGVGLGRADAEDQEDLDASVVGFAPLRALTLTLTKMAGGGVYDQLGGGFHRYSTDALWLVPHFEKMLYDNAQLARTYLHAWQATGSDKYRRVVEETLDYVLREMTAPAGGFYSTQDADSEGEEGKFFLWTPAEILDVLGVADARLVGAYFDITRAGNFPEGGPGASILHVGRDMGAVAFAENVSAERLADAITRGRWALFAARDQRVHPGRDEKILAEWNGLMIQVFAEAGAALDREEYVATAVRAADFVLAEMSELRTPAGESETTPSELRLYRSYKDGQARVNAYLEDYAAVALGLLALYEASFDRRWLDASISLAQTIQKHFSDPDGVGFFQTSDDHERLVARRKEFLDSAVPSGNSLAADLSLRLGALLDRPEFTRSATGVLQLMAEAMATQPSAFGRLLCALDFYLNPGPEIAIVGDSAAADTHALLAEVWQHYLPNKVLALRAPGDEDVVALGPLFAGRNQLGNQATAYVCQNYICDLPVTDPISLARALERAGGRS